MSASRNNILLVVLVVRIGLSQRVLFTKFVSKVFCVHDLFFSYCISMSAVVGASSKSGGNIRFYAPLSASKDGTRNLSSVAIGNEVVHSQDRVLV